MPLLPSLSELQAYHGSAIIDQFCQEKPDMSRAASRQIFEDLLGWMWLCVKRDQSKLKTHMIQPLKHLDAMWHVFILHTRAYHEFCQQYFADYFHHDFEVNGQAHELTEDELSEYLSACYDFLGEDWVLRNFAQLLA
jgi:hypothetical protein